MCKLIRISRRSLLAGVCGTASVGLLGGMKWPWSSGDRDSDPPPKGAKEPFRFLSPDSVWNLPIGRGARFASDADPATRQIRALDGTLDLAEDAWTVALWHARESDPMQTVVVNAGPTGRNDRIRIHIPADAAASPPPYRPGESDSHMSVVSPDGRLIHEFIGMHKVGVRTWGAGCYVPMPVDGSGIEHMTGFEIADFRIAGMLGFGSTRAYGGSSTAGLIVSGELEQGIDHMLACAAHIDMLTSPWVWPATRDDWHDNYPNNGGSAKVSLGMMFAIPPEVDLKDMKLGRREYHVLRAMQTHGLMVVDRGGRNWSIYMDYTARAEARRFDVDAISRVMSKHLARITNITPATPKGGD
ncbi:MAG: hypothetical protein OZ935_15310 [Pseudomonadota bacterium]|nr:hypothetical protein [Pseudomonadota bacterium]